MTNPTGNTVSDLNSKCNYRGNLVATAFRDKPGQPWNYKLYVYDRPGQVNRYYIKYRNNSWNLIENTFDNKGDLLKQAVNKTGTCPVYHWWEYDRQGRLIKAWTNKTDSQTSAVQDAEYTYKNDNQLYQASFPSMNYSSSTLTYEYHSRGWVGRISNTAGFKEQMIYLNNGTIQQQIFTYPSSLGWGQLNFSYIYDNINRLTSETCTQDAAKSQTYVYDFDGNFSSKTGNSTTSNPTITYTYTTGTNRLSSILYNGVSKSFTYDAKGNISQDANRGVSNFVYDHRNLPLNMTVSSNTYTYVYDDKGQRIAKTGNGKNEYYLLDQSGRELIRYDLNASTNKEKSYNIYGQGVIGRAEISWSGSTRTDTKYYYLKDHLGSIRMTLGSGGSIAAARDYYPFGGIIREYANGVTDRFKFTEKERDVETNYDYFGARYYDSELGRWMAVDPLASKYPSLSPYNYCRNNPLILIDPNGMSMENLASTVDDMMEKSHNGNDNSIFEKPKEESGGDGNNSEKDRSEKGSSSTLTKVRDFTAGAISNLSFGLTDELFDLMGSLGQTNPNSGYFKAGEWTGTAVGLLAGGKAIFNLGKTSVKEEIKIAGKISGYTRHGLNNAISRNGVGVSTNAILDAVRNPIDIVEKSNGTIRYIGEKAAVVLNKSGKIVTTWARNSSGFRIK